MGIITTWYLKGTGFAGYANEYFAEIEEEYKNHKVPDLRAFMAAGAIETGHKDLAKIIKASKRSVLIRILASFPHAFGVVPPEPYRLTSHV
jgi:hypothetical protein